MKTTTLTLDASQITQHLKCPLSRTLQYDHGLRIVDAPDRALNLGTVMHSLLEGYYRLRSAADGSTEYASEVNYMVHVKKVVEDYIQSKAWVDLISEEDMEFIVKRFTFYAIRYTGSGEDFQVMKSPGGEAGVELGFAKELTRIKTGKNSQTVFIVEGRVDLLAQVGALGGEGAIVDHKTQSMDGTLYRYLPQFRIYSWAVGMKYFIVNYIGFQKTGDPSKWFKRDVIPMSPFAIKQGVDMMKSVFFKIMGGGKYEQNFGACAGSFNKFPCQFTKICETESPELKDSIIQVNYVQGEKWRPW